MGLNKAKDYKGMKGFDVDLQFGKHFEELLDDIFKGVHTSEVKTERDQWVGYGNMVIETAYKDKPSGLAGTEADLWIHNFAYDGELANESIDQEGVVVEIRPRMPARVALRLFRGVANVLEEDRLVLCHGFTRRTGLGPTRAPLHGCRDSGIQA